MPPASPSTTAGAARARPSRPSCSAEPSELEYEPRLHGDRHLLANDRHEVARPVEAEVPVLEGLNDGELFGNGVDVHAVVRRPSHGGGNATPFGRVRPIWRRADLAASATGKTKTSLRGDEFPTKPASADTTRLAQIEPLSGRNVRLLGPNRSPLGPVCKPCCRRQGFPGGFPAPVGKCGTEARLWLT